ncbi:MAG: hypothetical protein R3346_04540 [Candidatus Spechtbacterales bacterium]|nr:hypothetical protein [Candidatus Spechtbacterales bacterium]
MAEETEVTRITKEISSHFPSFGGGGTIIGNPIAAALQNSPPQFAAGVDIEEVVRLVLMSAERRPNDGNCVDLDDLQEEIEGLLSLLKDRQPGLATWNSFLQQRIGNIHALIS